MTAVPLDDEPEKPVLDKTPWRLGTTAEQRARLCIRAAELRTKGKPFGKIADLLGLDSPAAAKKCVEVGYGLAPGDDLRTGRRKAADELDMLREQAWEIVENPGFKVAANGTVVLDPSTGEPLFDTEARVQALRLLSDLNKHYRTLLGADAPRTSIVASAGLDEIRAQIDATKAELAREMRERGLDDGEGLPALPMG